MTLPGFGPAARSAVLRRRLHRQPAASRGALLMQRIGKMTESFRTKEPAAFRAMRSFYFQGALATVPTGTLTMAQAREFWAWATANVLRGCRPH